MLWQEVFDSLCLTAEIPAGDRERLKSFCLTAADEINGKLKPGVNASDPRIVTAAAAAAYCDYLNVKNACEDCISSFKAGDITVTESFSEKTACAAAWRDRAMLAACEFFADECFHFGVM